MATGRLPPRLISLPELKGRHDELQREFDDHRVMVMLKVRDLEEQIQQLVDGERPSQVNVSIDPKRGHYRATLQSIPAWAIVVIVIAVCATVAYACSRPDNAPHSSHGPATILESHLGDQMRAHAVPPVAPR